MKLSLYSLILLFLLSYQAHSSVDKEIFIPIDDKKSISGGVITTLLQDKNGFIWIGTQTGLVRYDAYSFKSFEHDENKPDSLAGNYIRSVALAPDGKIWLGTLGNGLSIFDPVKETFDNYKHNPDDPQSLINNRIDSIAIDTNGSAWLGTNEGLDFFDHKTQQITHFSHDEYNPESIGDNHIRALMIDSKGDLWVGHWKGMDKWQKENGTFVSYTNPNESASSLVNKNILRLFESSNGDIWFGTPENGGGWISAEDGNVHWLPIHKDNADPGTLTLGHPWVTGIAELPDNKIWMATYGGGINVIDASVSPHKIIKNIHADSSIPYDLGTDEIGPLLMDNSGLLWVGTWGKGLKRFNTQNQAFKMFYHSLVDDKSLSSSNISSIMQSEDGVIWVGTSGNGIDLLNPDKGVVGGFRANSDDPSSLGDGVITAMLQLQDGSVWVGTRQSGLHYYNPQSGSFTRYTTENGLLNNYIHKLLTTDNDTLWIGTSGGLNRLDLQTRVFSTISTIEKPQTAFIEQIDSLAINSKGVLWIAAESGLFYLSPGAELLQKIQHDENRKSSLAHNDVDGLLVDSKDRLWVSTNEDLQLLQYYHDSYAEFLSVTEKTNNPSGISGNNLVEDASGNIWASAYEMIDTKDWKTHYFGIAEGVDVGAAWIRSYGKLNHNRIMYGGSKGLLMVEPDKLHFWDFNPDVVISDLQINGKEINFSDHLKLDAGTKSFTAQFSALDYSEPLKNKYSFQLEPYDSDWNKSSSERRVATYTNLDPGTYKLKVRGSNRYGVWSTKQLDIEVIQQAAWYQTLLFKAAIALLVLGIFYLIYLLRLKQLTLAEKQLKSKVRERTLELKNALKKVEKSSLTDPLTGINNRRYIDRNIESYIGDDNKECVFYLFDIDDFKSVNDNYGHQAGDEFLIQFTRLLKNNFDENDIIARWGGEEFLVVSKSQNRQSASKQAELICKNVRENQFVIADNKAINKTCSVGFVTYPFVKEKPDLTNWQEIISITDIALYAVKHSGKNNWLSITADSDTDKAMVHQLITNTESVIRNHFQIETSFDKSTKINFKLET